MDTNVQSATVGAEEARQILGAGRTVFYRLAREDKLPIPTIRVGKRFLFSRRAIDDLLAGRTEPVKIEEDAQVEDAD